jgi:hypothetical protein
MWVLAQHQGSKAAANGVTNWQGTSSIVSPLVAAFIACMGVGLVVLAAGTLEVARSRGTGSTTPTRASMQFLPLSIFWQVPQYVVVGASKVLTFISARCPRPCP